MASKQIFLVFWSIIVTHYIHIIRTDDALRITAIIISQAAVKESMTEISIDKYN